MAEITTTGCAFFTVCRGRVRGADAEPLRAGAVTGVEALISAPSDATEKVALPIPCRMEPAR